MKRQDIEKEMVSIIHTYDKGLLSKIYKEVLQVNKKNSGM